MYCVRCKKIVNQQDAISRQHNNRSIFFCPDCKRLMLSLGREKSRISNKERLDEYDKAHIQPIPTELKVIDYQPIKVDTVVAEFEDILHYNPDNLQARYDLGVYYYTQKKWHKALEALNQVLERQSEHFETLLLISKIYTAEKQFTHAEQILYKLLTLQPKNAEVNFHLGLLFANQNQFAKAKQMFKNALQYDPNFKQAAEVLQSLEKAV